MRVLVVGAGSAGRRHARNLASLGARLLCVDPRPDRLDQARAEIPEVDGVSGTLERALAGGRFDAAVIASPPSAHFDQATALVHAGIPLLLEKPPTVDLASTVALRDAAGAAGVPVLLGYTYRWWPPFVELRRRLGERAVGPLRHARFVMSAHLADWHPWERYQDFFMASQALGGGALLDESHFVDLMLWLFGEPESVAGRVEHLSSLEISTDDNVDVLACYPGGLRVSIHLDLYGRPHDRSVTVVGEAGTLQGLFDPPRLRSADDAAGQWRTTSFACERNDMFLAVAREFVDLVAGRRRAPVTCSLDDGVAVLRCVEAIRRSHAREATVPLAEVVTPDRREPA